MIKCDFLKERVEYVGHDILKNVNPPASSKFNLINDWALPNTGQSFFSFIGLVTFYHRFSPYHKMRLKILRKLLKLYYGKDIPVMAWSPRLIKLFQDLKQSVTSAPILARFGPDKPTLLITDWSAEGMGWILMQPFCNENPLKQRDF